MSEVSSADVRRRAMDFLARREHSVKELERKLLQRFPEQLDLIIDEVRKLSAEGLQSDQRLAEAFIRARSNRGQGPVKIRMELKSKGVADDIVAIAFEASDVNWFELARQVANRKFGGPDARLYRALDGELDSESDKQVDREFERKAQAKMSRFLQQRGFTFDHISSLD